MWSEAAPGYDGLDSLIGKIEPTQRWWRELLTQNQSFLSSVSSGLVRVFSVILTLPLWTLEKQIGAHHVFVNTSAINTGESRGEGNVKKGTWTGCLLSSSRELPAYRWQQGGSVCSQSFQPAHRTGVMELVIWAPLGRGVLRNTPIFSLAPWKVPWDSVLWREYSQVP